MNKLTVIIPTSPIPSHPSTEILDETIANIRKYTDAKIIIMFDGVHESLQHRYDDYKLYRARVGEKQKEYGHNTQVFFFEHTHQALMTRFVLDHVDTELVFFCEHDTSPIGDIPFNEICELVRTNPDINHLRFNIFHKILDEHQYLMLDKEPVVIDGIPMVRTIQYSQRPHIAKASWYRKMLGTHFGDRKTMIEDVMHSIVSESYKHHQQDFFGLAIYTPDGNQLRSYHSDARAGDEKITEA